MNNNSCNFDNDDLIAKYQLGILEEKECNSVIEHLKDCEICRQTLSELEEIANGLKLTAIEKLPSGFDAELHNKLVNEQKLLFSNSNAEPKKSSVVVFKDIFPIRRFVPIAAMLAVVILLSGKFGDFAFINSDTDTKTPEDGPTILAEHIETNTRSQFKAYDEVENSVEQSKNENSEDTSNIVDDGGNNTVDKIPKTQNNSDTNDNVTVAMNTNTENVEYKTDAIDNSTKADDVNLKKRAIITSENKADSTAESNALPEALENAINSAVSDDMSSEEDESGFVDKKQFEDESSGSSSMAGGSGGSGGGASAAAPMMASLEIYINVYTVEQSAIKNSEFANRTTVSENGENVLYLSNSDYDKLCEKVDVSPKFKETRVVYNSVGYDVIVIVE